MRILRLRRIRARMLIIIPRRTGATNYAHMSGVTCRELIAARRCVRGVTVVYTLLRAIQLNAGNFRRRSRTDGRMDGLPSPAAARNN